MTRASSEEIRFLVTFLNLTHATYDLAVKFSRDAMFIISQRKMKMRRAVEHPIDPSLEGEKKHIYLTNFFFGHVYPRKWIQNYFFALFFLYIYFKFKPKFCLPTFISTRLNFHSSWNYKLQLRACKYSSFSCDCTRLQMRIRCTLDTIHRRMTRKKPRANAPKGRAVVALSTLDPQVRLQPI